MSLERELRQLHERTHDAPWPGERTAYDQFLRRKVRRGRAMATGMALALAAIVGLVGVAPRILPKQDDIPPITPRGTVVQVPNGGFQLTVPIDWKVSRELKGAADRQLPGSQPSVVGLVLVPRSGQPPKATITVTTDERHPRFPGTGQLTDGRSFVLRQPPNMKGPGQYAVEWDTYCKDSGYVATCSGKARARALLITGSASSDAAGRARVLQVMQEILNNLQPITNALPAPPITFPAHAKVFLAKGGSGRTAWELWIERLNRTSSTGVSVHFRWMEKNHPGKGWHWESLVPRDMQPDGIATLMDCLSWVPGSGLLLSGLARKDVAVVRIKLVGRPTLVLPTLGRDKPVQLVAFASPLLPVGTKVQRIDALDAAGRLIGSENPYGDEGLCRDI
jgi:hypothetical protein